MDGCDFSPHTYLDVELCGLLSHVRQRCKPLSEDLVLCRVHLAPHQNRQGVLAPW